MVADVLAVNRFGCVGMSEPDAGSQVTQFGAAR